MLAPGVDVLGALASGISSTFFIPRRDPRGRRRYGYGSGTSYAAPEVGRCGSARLGGEPERSTQPALPRSSRRQRRTQGTWTKDLGFGTIDVAAAVQNATGGTVPVVTRPVVVTKPKTAKAKVRAAAKKTKRARP